MNAMQHMTVVVIVLLALVPGTSARAQSGDSFGSILGDVLGGILSPRPSAGEQAWRGHLVQTRGTTMIFRAEDGKVYAADMSAVHGETWRAIPRGQPITLAARPGATSQALIATRIEPEHPDRSGQLRPMRAFRTAEGTVERVEGSRVTVRTTDGRVVLVDLAPMTGEAEFRAHDGAVVILEPGPGDTVVWMEPDGRRGDGVSRGHILSGLSSEYRRFHAHQVQARGATMIVKADDGKTYMVDVSAVSAPTWHPIELGQAVSLAARPGRDAGTLIAARLRPDPPDRSTGKAPRKPFVASAGTIEEVRGSWLRFRMADGNALWADTSQLPGVAALQANDRATLTYEPGPGQDVIALWLERESIQPSAAPSAGPALAGQYQRINGYVQSAGWATISLKADDGRTLTVDTAHVDAHVRQTVRPGDLVSVVGKTTVRSDQFVAEFIEREARR